MIWLALYKLSGALHADPVATTFAAGIAALWLLALLMGAVLALLSSSPRSRRD